MNTATISTPALICSTFNEEGRCLEPEVVSIAMPKGCICELRLAQDAGGAWHVGYRLATSQGDELDAFPQVNADGKADRGAALLAAANDAQQFFAASPKSKLHRKCAGAVSAFIIALEGSPANKQPSNLAGQIPEPRNLDVEVEGITPNPHNPRGEISAASIAELAEAIAAVGLLQPVGIRLIPDEAGLPGVGAVRRELLWGHRRLEAFRRLKRATIPARVYEGISDDQARLLLLIENGQRKDLDPIQEARGYQEMMSDFDLTQDDIARSVKKSRPVIANAIRLLDLPATVQEQLATGALSTAHGTALCRFKDWPAVCAKIAELTIKNKSSANSLEKGLPFHEELESAKLVVGFWWNRAELFNQLKKETPSAFIEWKDGYEIERYGLEYASAKAALEAFNKEEAAREASRTERTEGGEMTPAAKRERAKKLDGNLTNRLQVSAMQHEAEQRLHRVKDIDLPSLLLVASEALAHTGYGTAEELAKRIGLTLPKDLENCVSRAERLPVLAKMKPADVLVLAAGCLAVRDAEEAMRYASEVPGFVDMLARPDPQEALDAASYVEGWREKILPLVKQGVKADQVQGRLECPEFIAVQLVREIRRDLRESGVPILTSEQATLLENMPDQLLAQYAQLIRDQGDKTDGQLAKEFADAKTAKAEIEAVRALSAQEQAQEQAWEKARKSAPEPVVEKPKPKSNGKAAKKKPAKKAAPAKKAKKGGKKK